MRMKLLLVGIVALGLTGCATVRHKATVVDATFAQAVFAVDDAEFKACQSHEAPFTVEVCAKTDPLVKQALLDVQAVTAAIKASPANGVVPVSVSTLLTDLMAIQAVVTPLSPSVVSADVSAKIDTALTETIKVLSIFAGSK